MNKKQIAITPAPLTTLPAVFDKTGSPHLSLEDKIPCLTTIKAQALTLADLMLLSDTELASRAQQEFNFLSEHTWQFSNRPNVIIAPDFLQIYQAHRGCQYPHQLFGDPKDHRWKAPIDQPFIQQLIHKELPFLDGTSIRLRIGQKPVHFIASQAPLPQQFNAFWKTLIWDQEVDLVLHLTAIREGDRLKSDNYWQEGHYPPIEVLNVESEKHALKSIGQDEVTHQKFLINTFQISNSNTGEKRLVRHIQTPDWKDGMAFSPDQLIHLSDLADTHSPDKPIIVHCSAGAGRTGQAIAYFILHKHIQAQKQAGKTLADIAINPLETVYQLRCLRPALILNPTQYAGIYQACKAAIARDFVPKLHAQKA